MNHWFVATVGVLTAVLVVAVGASLYAKQRAHEEDVARRHAVAAAVVRAQHEVAPALQALDAAPAHFANMDFYVTNQSAAQEAAPLLAGLAKGHAAVAAARETVKSAPATEPVAEYLAGLDEVELALDAFVQFVPAGVALGDRYQHSSTTPSAQRDIGSSGYAREEESMRAALRSDVNRIRGAELLAAGRKRLTDALELARAQEIP